MRTAKVLPWWLFLVVGGLLLGGCNWDAVKTWLITHRPRPRTAPRTEVATPSPHLPTAAASSGVAAPSPPPAPTGSIVTAVSTGISPQVRRVMQVCTGWELGMLNVRSCPGTECWVQNFLREGEVVFVSPTETVTHDGGHWVWIHSPTEGWVNLRYLCPVSPETPPTPGWVPTLDLPPRWPATATPMHPTTP